MAREEKELSPFARVRVAKDAPAPLRLLSPEGSPSFVLNGLHCACLESFLQGLKFRDRARQAEIFALPAQEAAAAAAAETDWKQTGMLYLQGEEYDRFSEDYVSLQRRVYETLLCDGDFRAALRQTGKARLACPERSKSDLTTTFTARELCARLSECRKKLHREDTF